MVSDGDDVFILYIFQASGWIHLDSMILQSSATQSLPDVKIFFLWKMETNSIPRGSNMEVLALNDSNIFSPMCIRPNRI